MRRGSPHSLAFPALCHLIVGLLALLVEFESIGEDQFDLVHQITHRMVFLVSKLLLNLLVRW